MLCAIIAYVFAQVAVQGCFYATVGASLTSVGPVIAQGYEAGWGIYSFEDATPLQQRQPDQYNFTCWYYTQEQVDAMDTPFRASRVFAMMGNILIGISMICMIIASCVAYTKSALLGISAMLFFGSICAALTFIFYASSTICGQYGCKFGIGSGLVIVASVFAALTAMLVARLPVNESPFRPNERPVAPAQASPAEAQPQAFEPGTQTITETVMPDGTKKITKTTVNSDGSRTVEETVEKP